MTIEDPAAVVAVSVASDESPAADGIEPLADQPVDVAGLPDTALRSALEFAIGIAAAGQKLRPPLVFPPALKTYLKFNRLDRMSLHAVRRAVVADEDFRSRIGGVATTELVDELGVAWLQRGENWQQTVRDLHAAARQSVEEASAEVALRKAERRREAAENVAARANAELLGHHDSLAREQVRRDRAEQALAATTAESTSLRNEITGLRREVDKLRQRLASETSRAEKSEQLVTEVGERLALVEKTRDEILAERASARSAAPVAGSDWAAEAMAPAKVESTANRAAARALQQAAGATRDLAAALATAAEALATPTPTPTPTSAQTAAPQRQQRSPRAPQRRPIAIPGGVYGDSQAAAAHVLRAPQAVVIVDGYNVAKLAWPNFELIDQRQMCIDLLEDFVRRNGSDIRVVFDGADVVGASAGRRLIRVQFSPAGVTADDVIRAEVQALPASTPVVVVTNDQAIVSDVRGDGANVVSSDMLMAVAGRPVTR